MIPPSADFDGNALAVIVAFASTRSNQMARHRLETDATEGEHRVKHQVIEVDAETAERIENFNVRTGQQIERERRQHGTRYEQAKKAIRKRSKRRRNRS